MANDVGLNERNISVIFRVYEKKLQELLTSNEYEALQHKAFRMLQIDDICNRDPEDDFTKFLVSIVNPSDNDFYEYNALKLTPYNKEEN